MFSPEVFAELDLGRKSHNVMTNFGKRHLANRRYFNLIYKTLHYGLSDSVTDCISFNSQCALYVLSQQQQLSFPFYYFIRK